MWTSESAQSRLGVCCATYWVGESKVGKARGSRRAGRPEGPLWGHILSPQGGKRLASGGEGVAGVREGLVLGGDFLLGE